MLEWSAAAEELFGTPRAVAVGLDLVELIVPAELRESVRESLLDEGRGAEETLGQRLETTARRADSSEFQVELTIVRAPAGDAGPTIFARDVSHRAEVELTRAHLALVVAGTQDAVLSKDLDGVVTSWNPAAEALYGYTAEEAVGRHVSFLVPDGLTHEVDKILGAVRRGEALDTYETRRRAQRRRGDRRRADDLADHRGRRRPLRRLGDRPRHHLPAPPPAGARVPDRRDPRPRRLARPDRDGPQHRRQSGPPAGRGLHHRLHPRGRADRRLGRRLDDPGGGGAAGGDPPRLAARPGRRPPGGPGAARRRPDDLARPERAGGQRVGRPDGRAPGADRRRRLRVGRGRRADRARAEDRRPLLPPREGERPLRGGRARVPR